MDKSSILLLTLLVALPAAAEYPNMLGSWAGSVRTVSSGDQVQDQVARGGAVISEVQMTFNVVHQDQEVFIGESTTDAPGATATPVWGAIRSTGNQAIFVTAGGGRGNIWFKNPAEFEYCFANQNQALMSAHCAVLKKSK